ncbi:B-type lectin plumieribetin-like [Salvelinus sp. IW2-2015]|uniref:B-type lectin plumieribetin-like n=1 Tax=Salvelinus sp. IW2-2015 TaxID=2691554 RepID=UPI0038D422BE
MSRNYMSKYDEMRKDYIWSNNRIQGVFQRDNKTMVQTRARSRFKMCRMYLRNDGNLVVEKDGEEMWNSSSSQGPQAVNS